MPSPLWLKLCRLTLLIAALALVAWSYRSETYEVQQFNGSEAKRMSAAEYVDGLTVDGYLRDNDELFDVYSNSPESVQIRDCHT